MNGEMYIADGDYIRDIEVNDLRNRYTLTKGSTQKMVNTPCVNISLIYQAFITGTRESWLHSPSPFLLSTTSFGVESSSLPEARDIALTTPSLASADSRCVTSRSKKKPELVRYTYLQLHFDIEYSC